MRTVVLLGTVAIALAAQQPKGSPLLKASSGQLMGAGANRALGGPTVCGNSSEAPVAGCTVSATLAGFHAESVHVAPLQKMRLPPADLTLKPAAGIDGDAFSGTTLSAPKNAREAWKMGTKARAKNESAEEERELRRAVTMYPKSAVAWHELNRLLCQNGHAS